MSEVRKVKNVRPLTCELPIELRLQNWKKHLLGASFQRYEPTMEKTCKRPDELVRIFGGHLMCSYTYNAAEVLLESAMTKKEIGVGIVSANTKQNGRMYRTVLRC